MAVPQMIRNRIPNNRPEIVSKVKDRTANDTIDRLTLQNSYLRSEIFSRDNRIETLEHEKEYWIALSEKFRNAVRSYKEKEQCSHWICNDSISIFMCAECKAEYSENLVTVSLDGFGLPNHCPNCGRKMEKE